MIQTFEQPIEVRLFLVFVFQIGDRLVLKGNACFVGDRFEVGVVAEDADEFSTLIVGIILLAVFKDLLEAVGFFGDEEGDAFGARAVQGDADLHLDGLAEFEQALNQFVERGVHFSKVDEHVHDELAMHDLLFDVENIDAALGEVGGEASDHALLILSDDGDDGFDGVFTVAGG